MIQNKEIYLIDYKYKKVFQKICQQALDKYKNTLPLDWEDIYNDFLFLIPKLLKKFDPKIGVSKKMFLFLECNYFANNQCRVFSSNKYKIMNLRSPLIYENSLFLSDSQKNHEPLDLSLLKDSEIEIYKLYFLEGKTLVEIQKMLNLTIYKVRRILDKVKEKLNLQLE